MSGLRTALGIATSLALVGGYAVSQIAFILKNPTGYSVAVDCPLVRVSSLVVLAAAVVFCLWKDSDSQEGLP
jgi:hypothetical protein